MNQTIYKLQIKSLENGHIYDEYFSSKKKAIQFAVNDYSSQCRYSFDDDVRQAMTADGEFQDDLVSYQIFTCFVK